MIEMLDWIPKADRAVGTATDDDRVEAAVIVGLFQNEITLYLGHSLLILQIFGFRCSSP